MKLEKISSIQMAILLFPMVVATGDLLIPAVMSQHAGRDAWISGIISSLTGYFTIFICYQLFIKYPTKTYVELTEKIIGRIPGKMIGFLTFFYFLFNNGTVVRQYGDFIVGTFLPRTPMVLVLGSMVFVCAFAVRGGIEVLARIGEMFVPIIILLWVLIIILLIPDMEPKNMLPILAHGPVPPLIGAIPPAGWYAHVMMASFLLPHVTDREKGMKWGMISVLFIFLTLFFINLATLFVFDHITSSLTYPVMSAVSYISIADFLEHLESIIMAIWVASAFLKISLYFYATNICFCTVFNLSDEKPTIFPLGLLLVTFSLWVSPNFQYLANYLGTIAPFANMTFEMIIPLFLLLVFFIRRFAQKEGPLQ